MKHQDSYQKRQHCNQKYPEDYQKQSQAKALQYLKLLDSTGFWFSVLFINLNMNVMEDVENIFMIKYFKLVYLIPAIV